MSERARNWTCLEPLQSTFQQLFSQLTATFIFRGPGSDIYFGLPWGAFSRVQLHRIVENLGRDIHTASTELHGRSGGKLPPPPSLTW